MAGGEADDVDGEEETMAGLEEGDEADMLESVPAGSEVPEPRSLLVADGADEGIENDESRRAVG